MVQLIEITPWWIYLLFTYFLMLGVRASTPTVASLKRLSVIPLFFLSWSLYHLYTSLENRYYFLAPWMVALLLGSFLGYLQVRNWIIRVDQERGTIDLPGSWSTMFLCLSFFIVKCLYGLTYTTYPTAYQNPAIFSSELVFSALFVGMFWGRFWHFSRAFYTAYD